MPHKDIAVQNIDFVLNYTDLLFTSRDLNGTILTLPSSVCMIFSAWFEVTTFFGDDPSFISSSFKDIGMSIGYTSTDYIDLVTRGPLITTNYYTDFGTDATIDQKWTALGVMPIKYRVNCALTDPTMDQLTQGQAIIHIAYGDMTLA